MALSDLQIFSEYLYSAMTEVVAQQVALFNSASDGTIILGASAHQGDYSDSTFFQAVEMVRRRNAYGSSAIPSTVLTQALETGVKVAAGTKEIYLNPSEMRWIQQNPAVRGAAMGQQLAKQTMEDMLNTSVAATYAALANVGSTVTYDGTGASPDTLTPAMLNLGAAKFGDRSSEIRAWIMHSYSVHNFYGNAITNTNVLFNYGTINVVRDPWGRLFIVSDIPSLFAAGSPNLAYVLGLVPGAIQVGQNNDFDDNWQKFNGYENIKQSYQAEWSYNLNIKGFAWDKSNGGASPTDAALTTGTNWDKIATSVKDLAGVIIKSN